MTNPVEAVTVEQCVMVCPQCEGEGGYADGLDEASCHTECTRCAGNGWIVDLARHRTQANETMRPREIAILIHSLLWEIGASKHSARDPVPVNGKTQWVHSQTILSDLDALSGDSA